MNGCEEPKGVSMSIFPNWARPFLVDAALTGLMVFASILMAWVVV